MKFGPSFVVGVIMIAGTAIAGGELPAVSVPPTVAGYLRTLGLTDTDFSELGSGRPVAKLLATSRDDELAALGAIRIDTAPMQLVERYRDIVRFESGTGVLSIGRFSTPPIVSDVARLEVPQSDLNDLPSCNLNDCAIQLSQTAIERFKKDIDWSVKDVRSQANHVMRTILVQYVQRYQQQGNDGLVVYRHRPQPQPLKASSLRLLHESRSLVAELPPVAAYLENYPHAPLPPGCEEFFYWSQLAFGLKPVTRANHVVIAPVTLDGMAGHVIVSRTIYASHYFRDGLEIRVLVPTGERSRRSFYFVNVNRSHSDSLRGFIRRLIAIKVRRSVRDSMGRYVLNTKKRLEGGFRP
jgi:hypothetical protein